MKIVDVRIVRKNEKHDVDEARGHPIIFVESHPMKFDKHLIKKEDVVT